MERTFNHDELHRLTETDPHLKRESDRIHRLPRATDWVQWIQRKKVMITLWGNAVGCRNTQTALDSFSRIAEYFSMAGFADPSAWHACSDMRPHLDAIAREEVDLAEQHWCHVPGGNTYRCYCEPPVNA